MIARLPKKRINLLLTLLLALLLTSALVLSSAGYFSPLRQSLQGDSVPMEILRYGPMGKLLVKLGLITYEPNDFIRFPQTHGTARDIETITFQKKRQVGATLLAANPSGDVFFESSAVIDPALQKKGWPILSVVTDPIFLNHPETGLLQNKTQKGRKWERPAQLSYIEDGQVLFETGIGLRLHGGSRLISKTWSPDYKLYFRPIYGLEAVPDSLILPDQEVPLRTLVVKMMDWPEDHPVNNPLAYDISREIGSIAPQTRLVEFYLNGESKGMAFAVEHLSRRQWGQRFEHEEYTFYKFKNENRKSDKATYLELFWQNVHADDEFSYDLVAADIDLDNLSRQLFSWVFASTNDYCQGVAIYDHTNPEARLSWINWDMDHSFYYGGSPESSIKKEIWKLRGFDLVNEPPFHCGRSELFHRLMQESKQFRLEFVTLVTHLMNHNLTDSFLLERVQYYEEKLNAFGDPNDVYIKLLNLFFTNRSDHLFHEIHEMFGFSKPYTLSFSQAEDTIPVSIDGVRYTTSYEGQYFTETPVTLSLANHDNNLSLRWLVNGERRNGGKISINMEKDTIVELMRE